ncbi:hypothetical protein D3C74_411570 [compost metagenome]
MIATVRRLTTMIWVRMRRACRLSTTSTRNRLSALSSSTNASAPTHQAPAAMSRTSSRCSTAARHSTVGGVVTRTAIHTATTIRTARSGRRSLREMSRASSLRRPIRFTIAEMMVPSTNAATSAPATAARVRATSVAFSISSSIRPR